MAAAELLSLSSITCMKGMDINISVHIIGKPYPYPVIHPRKKGQYDFPFLCDTATDSGGWIVIQRRATGNVDFDREWDDYKNGFGELDGDFWMGNDRIHEITSSGDYELRVELRWNWKNAYANYATFSVDSEENNYKLTVGGYSGTAGDSLGIHNNMAFSTPARDNDAMPKYNCAKSERGGWWYNACEMSNLNGIMGRLDGMDWGAFGKRESMWSSEMKIRRKSS